MHSVPLVEGQQTEITYIIIQYRLVHDDEREGRVGLGWYGYCTDLLVGATDTSIIQSSRQDENQTTYILSNVRM